MIISISPVLVADTNKKLLSVLLLVSGERRNTNRRFEMNALIDSGAGETFIDKKFAQQNGDITVKQLCMNLHFFRGLVSAMNIILGHYNLIILLELIVWMATLRV